ncbi:hypothetical protein H2203_009173 [Taxawa tesnikishii (nom. ined.)]|nr:hypothetical protein H2203_009173 [Dothideales sp. JES 119]
MAAATPQRPDPPHNNGITDTVASSATTMVASAERTFANTSPASTYGETAVGEESSPSTPRDRESKIPDTDPAVDKSPCKPAVRSTADQQSFGRPPPRMRVKSYHQKIAVPRGSQSKVASATSSPASLEGMVEDMVNYWQISSNYASSTRSGSPVFTHGLNPSDGDVFVETHSEPSEDEDLGATRSDRRSSSPPGSPLSMASTAAVDRTPCPRPRYDRLKQEPTADNAQGMFLPEDCVFVANLSRERTDAELEAGLNDIMSPYGTVFIKVRRDHASGMPFGHAQFTNHEDATKALMGAKGKELYGRGLRTEMSLANRSLFVFKHIGGYLNTAEVLRILQQYGPIERSWPASETEREMFQLPEGLFVRFTYYDDCRDAKQALRQHPTYRFDQRKDPSLPRTTFNRASRFARRSVGNGQLVTSRPEVDWSKTELWLGDLPGDVETWELEAFLAGFAGYEGVQIRKNKTGHYCFAYARFKNPQAAVTALRYLWGYVCVRGSPVRIQFRKGRGINVRHISSNLSLPPVPAALPPLSMPQPQAPLPPYAMAHPVQANGFNNFFDCSNNQFAHAPMCSGPYPMVYY